MQFLQQIKQEKAAKLQFSVAPAQRRDKQDWLVVSLL